MRRWPVIAATLCLLALPSAAHARGCTEVSDVTGEKKCSRFGSEWSLEGTVPILFRFGMRYSDFTLRDLHFTGPKAKGVKQSVAYDFDGPGLGFTSLHSVALDGGFGVFLWGGLYTTVESHLSIGHVDTRDLLVPTPGQTLRLTQDSGINTSVFGSALALGYRIPLGRAAIRAEWAIGFDAIDFSHHVILPDSRSWTGTSGAVRALVEPRIAGEIWFTQHIAFAVAGGINLIGGNTDHSLSISLAWHHRAFDGASTF